MSGELGKASYLLDADLEPLRRAMAEGRHSVDEMEGALDALTEISKLTEHALHQVRMGPGQGGESRGIAETIISGVRGISEEARDAARELDHVKLTETQATESAIAGERIKRNVNDIGDEADRTKRKLAEVKLAGGRNGVGVGIFGSGFGRIGLLGGAIGAGVLATPAAGPGALGLLAAVPTLAGAAAGSLGVLALAFDGVGKAIHGDKKAFDDLGPSAQQFVLTVRSLDGWFDKLRQTAAAGLFPGLAAGLKAALSPSTVNAITTAVSALAHALGEVGRQWGAYFGSSQFQQLFGPLMQSGARTITTLSDAMLRLFDAIGVVARAAIPFTDWLMSSIDHGAKFADTWLRAKDATGQLSGAMTEAETSLRLVGGLLESLLRVIGALGSALYPVSKVAVKDLTDGLNALSGIIHRNEAEIRGIVLGALQMLVAAVKLAADGIGVLWHGLNAILTQKGTIIAAIVAIGAALMVTLGPTAGSILAVLAAVGLIKQHWQQLSAWILIASDKLALGIVEPFSHLPGVLGGWARKAKDAIEAQLESDHQRLAQIGADNGNAYGSAFSNAALKAIKAGNPNDIARQQTLGLTYEQWKITNPKGTRAEYNLEHQIAASNGPFYTQQDIRKLLLANGVPADVATNLSIISARGEDPSGNAQALNNNARTGDYSVGLFQENFLGQMGVDRVKRFAPMFGLSPTTPVKAFVAWLGKHPAAQAQIAYQIYQDQGYKAWTTAAGLGITDQASQAGSPFGSDPAWTKNTGPKSTPPVIPNMITDLLNRASANASKSKQLSNLGGTAKRYLEGELADLTAADLALHKLTPKNAKQRQEIAAKETEVENKIRDVNTLIAHSAFAAGAALLPDSLKTKLAALTAKFKADSAWAQVLVGQAAEDFATTLKLDVSGQATVLSSEVDILKRRLAGATGKQKTAIQTELDKVTSQLATVQQQVAETLRQTVQIMQKHVATAFAKVQQQLLAQLGIRYYQNGALTPLEQQLAGMQAEDAKNSLQDALKQAQDQKAADIAANASAIAEAKQAYDEAAAQLDAAKNDPAATASDIEQLRVALQNAKKALDAVSDPGRTQQQITLDQAAISQAQRAIDENDLAIRAAAERAKADADYATKSQELTDKLATLSDAFQNGTATMSDLTTLAGAYGIQITTETIPAFSDLQAAVGDSHSGLIGALNDLAAYIEKITGHNPSTNTDNGNTGGGKSKTVQERIAEIQATGNYRDALTLAATLHSAIPMAAGTPGPVRVTKPTLFLAGEAGAEDAWFSGGGRTLADQIGGGGGRGDIILEVDGREIARASANGLARDRHATRIVARTVKPALASVVSLS